MLTIEIICVGKLNQSFLADGCAEYVKRLMPFTKILLTELPEEKLQSSNRGAELQVIDKESDRILARLAKTRAHCAALCVEGEQKSSE
ncbi:MAG: 23S rRNA (pseudouridine(1915)-N(3))-methyltransferase RlmH, partial [Oscillospiraceae bacterium]